MRKEDLGWLRRKFLPMFWTVGKRSIGTSTIWWMYLCMARRCIGGSMWDGHSLLCPRVTEFQSPCILTQNYRLVEALLRQYWRERLGGHLYHAPFGIINSSGKLPHFRSLCSNSHHFPLSNFLGWPARLLSLVIRQNLRRVAFLRGMDVDTDFSFCTRQETRLLVHVLGIRR